MAAQVLGAAAGCLGALGPKFAEESAEPFLVALRLCIFPLLEALGDFSAILAETAEIVLCRFCVATCDITRGLELGDLRRNSPTLAPSPTVRSLIAAHSDFLLDALVSRLRHAAWHPRTPLAVHAVLEYGGDGTLSLMGDVIDALFDLVDDAADPAGARAPPAPLLPCVRALRALVDAADGAEAARRLREGDGKERSGDEGTGDGDGDDGCEGDGDAEAGDDDDDEECLSAYFDGLFGRRLFRRAEPSAEPSAGDEDDADADADADAAADNDDDDDDDDDALARVRAEEAEEAAARAPPPAPALALRVIAKAEMLLLRGGAQTTHVLLDALVRSPPASHGKCRSPPAAHGKHLPNLAGARSSDAQTVAALAPSRALPAVAAARRARLGEFLG